VPDFAALLHAAGFAKTQAWTDPAHRFAVLWATA
jgi:L-histidine N-alpha-methyltransferase